MESKHALFATAVYLFGMIVERGALFILLPFITRHLSPSQFGEYSLLVLSGTVVNYFIVSPTLQALERFFYDPTYEVNQKELVGGLVLVLAAKAACAAVLYDYVTGYLAPHQDIATDAYVAVVFLSPFSCASLLLLQLKQRATFCAAVSVASVGIGSGVSIGCLVVGGFGTESLVFGSIVQSLIVVLSSLPFVINESRWVIRWSVIAAPLRWGYSLLPASYCDLILQSGDRYLLAWYCGIGSVGIYDLGYRIASLISFLLSTPVKRGLHPLILKMERRADAQRRFIRMSCLWVYLGGLLLAVPLAVFSREVVSFVSRDESFWPASTVCVVIAFAYVQHAIGYFLNYGIVMAKKVWCDNICVFVAAVSNVLLNLVLIPMFGINGAAMATLVSFVLWNSMKAFYSKQLYGVTFDLRGMGYATAIAALSVGCAIAFDLFEGLSQVPLECAKLCCVASFPLGLYFSGWFGRPQLEPGISALIREWRRLTRRTADFVGCVPRKVVANEQHALESHPIARAGDI